MTVRKFSLVLISVGFMMASAASHAQVGGYIGGSFGQSEVDVSGYDEANSWQLFAGANLSPYFALEAAYTDLGEFDLSGASNTYVDVYGVEFTAVGIFPLSNTLSFFGEAGLFSWTADATYLGVDIGSDDGTDLTYGFGVRFRLVDELRLHLEYQAYPDISDGDIDTFYGGLSYGF